jgi:hypothetical protein
MPDPPMPDPWDKAELVAECERLREWLLLRMDDEARERSRGIADQYFALARPETKISAHARIAFGDARLAC